MQESESDSEDELETVGCSVESFSLIVSLLTISICHRYTAATSIDNFVEFVTNCFQSSVGGMVIFFTE